MKSSKPQHPCKWKPTPPNKLCSNALPQKSGKAFFYAPSGQATSFVAWRVQNYTIIICIIFRQPPQEEIRQWLNTQGTMATRCLQRTGGCRKRVFVKTGRPSENTLYCGFFSKILPYLVFFNWMGFGDERSKQSESNQTRRPAGAD